MLACGARLFFPAIAILPLAWSQPSKPDASSLRFEVAAIKPNQGVGRPSVHVSPGGERYTATSVILKRLIMDAYRVRNDQVTGGPGWIGAERFDINAKAERPSTLDEVSAMLRNLLTDRFHLQVHRASKELPVYVLGVESSGSKLMPAEVRSAGDAGIESAQERPFHIHWKARSVALDYVAWQLSQFLDRPVVDGTGLKGAYDFELSYTAPVPDTIPAGALLNGQPIDASGPTIFEALRRQLGLRLAAQKAPIDVIVVDHAEKPAEN